MLAGSPVLLPQSSHSSSFSTPHPHLPTVLPLPSPPPVAVRRSELEEKHTCHVRQIPRKRTETRAYPFIFGEDPAAASFELSETPPHLPPPPPPTPAPGGWLEEGLLLPIQYHLLPISWAGMQDKSILGWEWQGFSDRLLPATPAASPFSEIHTIPPEKAGGDAGSLHGGPAASPPAPLGQDHTLHT